MYWHSDSPGRSSGPPFALPWRPGPWRTPSPELLLYMYIHMYIHMCVYIYIYIYVYRERYTHVSYVQLFIRMCCMICVYCRFFLKNAIAWAFVCFGWSTDGNDRCHGMSQEKAETEHVSIKHISLLWFVLFVLCMCLSFLERHRLRSAGATPCDARARVSRDDINDIWHVGRLWLL